MIKKALERIQFTAVPAELKFAEMDEKVLDFWKRGHIFEQSIDEKSKDKVYSFYDGPPFITGLPHYGSLLSSIAKDVVLRYWTMKGYRIRRVWGWDCHGLPAETAVEKNLKLKCKRDIEEMGVGNFIEACRSFVSKTSSEWEWYVDRIGRWVDFKNAYRTMDRDYMETVLWVFKELYHKGLIYKGRRVSLYCPRCATPLSKFEITMDEGCYRNVSDPAITIKFKVKNKPGTFILAWTTTPWTLPTNFALAVDPRQVYVEVEQEGEKYILAQRRYKENLPEGKVLQKFKGDELVGWEYEPLFSFFAGNENDFKVYPATFVTTDEGTGVVHIAPGFGEDDSILGEKFHLSLADSLDDEGRYIDKVKPWAGINIKEADPLVIVDLRERGLLFKEEKIVHSYPFCYRCDTPLIYKSQEAWYVDIDKIRKSMLESNKKIYWFPAHFKYGRFAINIKSAPHWCISRTRYWGTPLPVWECQCGERYVFGSIKEIEEASGQKVTDLHRPDIDKITVKCRRCQGEAKRVPEVLDCWMESGAMPYGEWHYPFENEEQFKRGFPADFISEYTGQLRAWFYYLHVLSNALLGTNCFRNSLVTGVILGSDGKKMSKSRGNFPDPKEILLKYGGDALRLYLISSQVMAGEDLIVSEEGIAKQVRNVLLPLWNSYRYFVTFAQLRDWCPTVSPQASENILDRWLESRLWSFLKEFTDYFKKYNVQKATELVPVFIDDLSRWYIRRSRERFQEGDLSALNTLYSVLTVFAKAVAPILPFITEEMYKNLTGNISVHLENWPKALAGRIDKVLEAKMALVREISELGNAKRRLAEIRVRQPLPRLTIFNLPTKLEEPFLGLIKDELNVKEVVVKQGKGELTVELDTTITPELEEEGETREIIRQIQEARKEAGCGLADLIEVGLPSWPKKFEEEIKKKTLARKLYQTEKLEIKKCL
jgi:isoleucyl-tRNA synthetase